VELRRILEVVLLAVLLELLGIVEDLEDTVLEL
jgi:hypothetical protein